MNKTEGRRVHPKCSVFYTTGTLEPAVAEAKGEAATSFAQDQVGCSQHVQLTGMFAHPVCPCKVRALGPTKCVAPNGLLQTYPSLFCSPLMLLCLGSPKIQQPARKRQIPLQLEGSS